MFQVLPEFWLQVFVLCLFVFSNGLSLNEGDTCKNNNPNAGSLGKCKSAFDCTWALRQIRQRQKVDICRSNGKNPIVCCPLNEEPIRPATVTDGRPKPEVTDTRGDTNSTTNYIYGKVSKKKCEEYHKFSGGVGYRNGIPSLAQEFPHMAILGFGSEDEIQWKCGGSLVSLRYVLTAAHCLYSRDLGEVKYVRLGDLDIKNQTDDAEPQDFTVKRTIPHPGFDSTTVKNDIAIIELSRPVRLTSYVIPICFHLGNSIGPNFVLTASGWGATEFAGEPNSHLRKVWLEIVPNKECRKQYERNGPRGKIDEAIQVCAGTASNEEIMDTCQGDSGGPLQITDFKSRKYYYIVGITSFGKACGITRSPGIYTRVSFYIPWIESIVF